MSGSISSNRAQAPRTGSAAAARSHARAIQNQDVSVAAERPGHEAGWDAFATMVRQAPLDLDLLRDIERVRRSRLVRRAERPREVIILGAGHLGWGMHLDILLQAGVSGRGTSSHLVIPRPSRRAATDLAHVQRMGGTSFFSKREDTEHFVPVSREDILLPPDRARLREAIRGAGILVLVVPDIASARQPLLHSLGELEADLDDKLLVLAPGGTGSPFCALELLDRFPGLQIALAETAPYAVRMNGRVEATRKHEIQLAGLRSADTGSAVNRMNDLLPLSRPFRAAQHPLELLLGEHNYIFHVAVTFHEHNLTRLIRRGAYLHYTEGVTPAVAETMEALDRERLDIGHAFGLRLESIAEWLDRAYRVGLHDSLHVAFQRCAHIYGFSSPTLQSLPTHRTVLEDLPAMDIFLAMADIGGVSATATRRLRQYARKRAIELGAPRELLDGYGSLYQRLPRTVSGLKSLLGLPA